jgi:coenzyme F420-reducing hydrogenase delta subunit
MDNTPIRIIAYNCEHCAYAAADLAGGLRLQYPPEINIVQVPCTGRVDVLTILRALEDGIDGVMVAG